MLSEHIESSIKKLKSCKHSDEKTAQYKVITDAISRWFKRTNTKRFTRTLILSFFETGFFPNTTQNRHAKNIIDTLKINKVITNDKIEKSYFTYRTQQLKSVDYGSYSVLLKKNGYDKINYYNFIIDKKTGVPRRQKIGTSDINGNLTNENGELLDFDISVLNQTRGREQQKGVKSLGSKSIIRAKQKHAVKCFIVN